MQKGRLKWALRRGMLELDLVLEAFYQNGYADLEPKEKNLFHVLLESSDPELQQWLLNQEPHSITDMEVLIEKIRPF